MSQVAPPGWKYFSYTSDPMLACPCCGDRGLVSDLVTQYLDPLREALNFPLVIGSGYRCSAHNNQVSSTGNYGPHTLGKAVDVVAFGAQAYQIVGKASAMGFTGIGLKQLGRKDKRFVHLDIVPSVNKIGAPRPWIWTY